MTLSNVRKSRKLRITKRCIFMIMESSHCHCCSPSQCCLSYSWSLIHSIATAADSCVATFDIRIMKNVFKKSPEFSLKLKECSQIFRLSNRVRPECAIEQPSLSKCVLAKPPQNHLKKLLLASLDVTTEEAVLIF